MRLSSRSLALRFATGLLVAGFLAAGGLGLAPARASGNAGLQNGPAIWKIDSDKSKSRVYLFGSVHMLKQGLVWLTPKIKNAFLSATDLTLETNINPAGVDEIRAFVQREGVYPQGDSLKNHISAALFKETVAAAGKAGIPAAGLERLKPWYAAVLLGLQSVKADGYSGDAGVEITLQTEASARNMPISGLETISEQMQTLSGGSPKVQEAMLADTLRELKDTKKLLSQMSNAWISGDEVKMVKYLIVPMQDMPEAYQAIVVGRNRNWVPKIEAMLARPGTHFVVVGAAHLVGRDGVVQMLRDQGVEVERY